MTVTDMQVPAIAHFVLPDSPYAMWVRGELANHMRVPEGFRVEIVGGEIEVSPGPMFDHGMMVEDIHAALIETRVAGKPLPWRALQVMDLNLVSIGDGYIPDLVVVDRAAAEKLRGTGATYLTPDQLTMAVEVTSRSTASNDRQPSTARTRSTKWNGYAAVGVPYCLLVDRAPQNAYTILYSEPQPHQGVYASARRWAFGERVDLPVPLNFGFDTAAWTVREL